MLSHQCKWPETLHVQQQTADAPLEHVGWWKGLFMENQGWFKEGSGQAGDSSMVGERESQQQPHTLRFFPHPKPPLSLLGLTQAK